MRKAFSITSLMVLSLAAGCAAQTDEGVSTDEPLTPSPVFLGDVANNAPFAVDVSMWEGPIAQSETDCMWASGVRHLIAGTQVEEVTRQQLAMAVSRGMTVDGYVYLYWDQDVTAQVNEAFRRTKGFPIGRMWLDVEQDPAGLGANALIKLVQQAYDACTAQGTADCGIYTGPGFWKTYMNNTTSLSNLPLWYAQYDYKTSLSDWTTQHFGGWAKPVAKQWAEQALCGVGVDKDVMQVITKPQVVVDRTLPPDTKLPPPAPGNLYPADNSVVGVDYVKLMSATIPRATSYQLALERWTGSAWTPYYTWTNANAFIKASPAYHNAVYRFRARAQNAYGWGAWSAYATFDYGKYTGTRPGANPPPPNPPPPNPPPAGVPGSLAPDGGVTVTTSAVTLSYSAVQGATSYEVAIEYGSGQTFTPYYTYAPTAASQTFYPAIRNTSYRWRARAKVSGVFGAWSTYATFQLK